MQYSCWFSGFFFSSRRRHTRWPRDWSSDVCSSDLHEDGHGDRRRAPIAVAVLVVGSLVLWRQTAGSPSGAARSEERRVGKEVVSRSMIHYGVRTFSAEPRWLYYYV